MKNQFLEAGQIVNTHGIQGAGQNRPLVRQPRVSAPVRYPLSGRSARKGVAARVHKGNILAALEGVADVERRHGPQGQDRLHRPFRRGAARGGGTSSPICSAWRFWTPAAERSWGVVADVLTPPAHEVYVVKGEHEYMIPAVDEFLAETNVEGGYIKVRLIEGMRTDV